MVHISYIIRIGEGRSYHGFLKVPLSMLPRCWPRILFSLERLKTMELASCEGHSPVAYFRFLAWQISLCRPLRINLTRLLWLVMSDDLSSTPGYLVRLDQILNNENINNCIVWIVLRTTGWNANAGNLLPISMSKKGWEDDTYSSAFGALFDWQMLKLRKASP